jgi:hypothetical protein
MVNVGAARRQKFASLKMFVPAGIIDVVAAGDPSDGGLFATTAVVGTRHIGAWCYRGSIVEHEAQPISR